MDSFVDRRISRLFPVETRVGEEEVGVAHLEVEAPVWLAIVLQLDKRFYITRPKPAYGRQGLDWIVRPGYSFVVFSTVGQSDHFS